MRRLSFAAVRAVAGLCATLALNPRANGQDLFYFDSHIPTAPEIKDLHILNMNSSLGQSVEFRYDLSQKLKLRSEFNDSVDNVRGTVGDAHYMLNFKLRSTSLLLDWHPAGGAFRATGGLVINQHELRAIALPAGVVTVEGQSFALKDQGRLTGTVAFRSYTPYIGIGWGHNNPKRHRLRYSVDIGVMYHGTPSVTLGVQGPLPDIVKREYPAEVAAALARKEQEANEKLRDFKYFPVVSVGVSYRF